MTFLIKRDMIWARSEKTCFSCITTTKCRYQDEYLNNHFNAFIFHLPKGGLYLLSTCKLSIFELVSVSEHTVLSLCWSETLKTGFSRDIKDDHM